MGLQNSATAMIDDLLVLYASAQLMIANDSRPADATVIVNAIRFGQTIYVILAFVFNCLIIIAVLIEVIRTHGWRDLSSFDYNDLSALAAASSNGGNSLGIAMAGAPQTVSGNSTKLGGITEGGNSSRVRKNAAFQMPVILQQTSSGFSLGISSF